MTRSVQSDSSAAADSQSVLYGKILQQARKQQNLSIEQVAEAIHVKAEIIEALESSATEGLPPAAFTQGYLRAYARYVEAPVEQVLHDFSTAVPHQTETPLRARSRLPKQAGTHTPVIKILSLALMVLFALALIYSAYSYYTNKASHDAESEAAGVERLPQIEQHARLENGELSSVNSEGNVREDIGAEDDSVDGALNKLPTLTLQPEFESLAETLQPHQPPVELAASLSQPDEEPELAITTGQVLPKPPQLPRDDEITIHAERDSWVEITDAAGRNLYYNMLRGGRKLEFKGTAPFDMFFGNAPAITLSINGVDINMKRYIRPNNVARFRVSTQDDEAVFHPRS